MSEGMISYGQSARFTKSQGLYTIWLREDAARWTAPSDLGYPMHDVHIYRAHPRAPETR